MIEKELKGRARTAKILHEHSPGCPARCLRTTPSLSKDGTVLSLSSLALVAKIVLTGVTMLKTFNVDP